VRAKGYLDPLLVVSTDVGITWRQAAHKKLSEISGAMKKRVGIARAVDGTAGLLIDEPFGALDALTRAKLQDDLLGMPRKKESTVVMITHDVDEAGRQERRAQPLAGVCH